MSELNFHLNPTSQSTLGSNKTMDFDSIRGVESNEFTATIFNLDQNHVDNLWEDNYFTHGNYINIQNNNTKNVLGLQQTPINNSDITYGQRQCNRLGENEGTVFSPRQQQHFLTEENFKYNTEGELLFTIIDARERSSETDDGYNYGYNDDHDVIFDFSKSVESTDHNTTPPTRSHPVQLFKAYTDYNNYNHDSNHITNGTIDPIALLCAPQAGQTWLVPKMQTGNVEQIWCPGHHAGTKKDVGELNGGGKFEVAPKINKTLDYYSTDGNNTVQKYLTDFVYPKEAYLGNFGGYSPFGVCELDRIVKVEEYAEFKRNDETDNVDETMLKGTPKKSKGKSKVCRPPAVTNPPLNWSRGKQKSGLYPFKGQRREIVKSVDMEKIERYLEFIQISNCRGKEEAKNVPKVFSGEVWVDDKRGMMTQKVTLVDVLPPSDWIKEYLYYLIPNDVTSIEKCVSKFNLDLYEGTWAYSINTKAQPLFSSVFKRLPLRLCGQNSNFYEPFIIRIGRLDGERLTREEVKYKLQHPKLSNENHYFIEGLCPYCHIDRKSIRTGVNSVNDYFYNRETSDYLHHITKHHSVYSNGKEQEIPEFIGCTLDKKYYAKCPHCDLLTAVKNPREYVDKEKKNRREGHPFLGYIRHIVSKHKVSKSGSTVSSEVRFNEVVNEIEDLIFYTK